jgi:hypothetical protein
LDIWIDCAIRAPLSVLGQAAPPDAATVAAPIEAYETTDVITVEWCMDATGTWNPWNKVVHCRPDGTIDLARTHAERVARGLPVPWTPEIGEIECRQAPVW